MSAISELSIEFYDDPARSTQRGSFWVQYTGSDDSGLRAMDLATYFWKVDFCLGKGKPSLWLRTIMRSAITAGFDSRPLLLAGDGYALQYSQRLPNPSWACQSRFFSDRPPITEFGIGGEDYYAPMSVIAFLQHLIDTMPQDSLRRFSLDLRLILNIPDGSTLAAPPEAIAAAQAGAQLFDDNDAMVWFMLPMMMDIERPGRWRYGPVDLAADVQSNAFFLGRLLDNGFPIPAPALATEWTWREEPPRTASPVYGPRYFPDHPNPSFVGSMKHKAARDNARRRLGVVEALMNQGVELDTSSCGSVDLRDYVYGSPERYTAYVDWLAEDHPQYFLDPTIRIKAHFGVAEYMTFDDASEAASWIRSGNRLFAVSRSNAEKIRSFMTVDEQKIRAVVELAARS